MFYAIVPVVPFPDIYLHHLRDRIELFQLENGEEKEQCVSDCHLQAEIKCHICFTVSSFTQQHT